MTTQPLFELMTASDQERTSAIGSSSENQRAKNLVLWGFITMLLGVVIGVVGKKLLHEDIITVVGVVISLAGMLLVVYPYLSPAPRKRKDISEPTVLTPSRSTEYLPHGSSIEYVPSITERTTDLLKDSAAKRTRKEEDGDLKDLTSQEGEKP